MCNISLKCILDARSARIWNGTLHALNASNVTCSLTKVAHVSFEMEKPIVSETMSGN